MTQDVGSAVPSSDQSNDGHSQDEAEELVTVIVPAKNEENAIAACVDSIRAQDWQNLKIIIVDGDSTDNTCQIVDSISAEDPRVELLHNPAGIIPISLNIALAAARARYLVRVDAHAHIPPGYVSLVMSHFRENDWGGVGGRKDGIGEGPAGRAIAVAMASPFGVGNSTYHHGTEVQIVDHIPFGAYPVELARELGRVGSGATRQSGL